jgi:CRISPR type III-B/RAMP module RAMP protein Cmr4
MNSRILMILTRTPLHIGAGSSVGAIDQPIVRERHTGFPVIPASSLKGTFADAWNGSLENQDRNRFLRVTTRKDDKRADGDSNQSAERIPEAGPGREAGRPE